MCHEQEKLSIKMMPQNVFLFRKIFAGDCSGHVLAKSADGSGKSGTSGDGVALDQHHQHRQDQHGADDVRAHHDGQPRVEGPQTQVQQPEKRFGQNDSFFKTCRSFWQKPIVQKHRFFNC